MKFEGCYHGHSDAMLVKAGSGRGDARYPGVRGSAGRRRRMHTLALPYNDLDALRTAFERSTLVQIACVIVEPVVGNAGTIAPAVGVPAGAAVDLHDRAGCAADYR